MCVCVCVGEEKFEIGRCISYLRLCNKLPQKCSGLKQYCYFTISVGLRISLSWIFRVSHKFLIKMFAGAALISTLG